MDTTSERAERAEAKFRELMRANGLREPDEVEHDGDVLRFLWHDQRVCVVIELED